MRRARVAATSLRRTTVLAALLVASTAVGAQQTEIGSRVAQRAQTASVKSGSQSVVDSHLYAECIVHRRASLSASYLELTDPSVTGSARANLGRQIECNNTQISSEFSNEQRLSIPTDLYRGMIAEALIAARFVRATPAPVPLAKIYVSPWVGVSGRAPAVEEMGICVAATDPEGIKVVLASSPESSEELAALRALAPAMGSCLAANVKLTANRQSIRATLAEALYHRLASPVLAPTASSEKK